MITLALALAFLAPRQDDDLRRIQELQQRLRSVCDKVKPAYVFYTGGSGVCISADGWVLTNFHVAGNRDGVRVRMSGGKSFTADVVGWIQGTDISLVKLRDAKDLPHCELGDSDALRVGDAVIAVGNPFMLGNGSWEPTITYGIVSALHRYMDNPGYSDAIQTDAQINPGNSGGPLLTMEGRVIGINGRIDVKRFTNRVNTGIGYAIPSNLIRRYRKALEAGGRVYEGFIDGITLGECGDSRYENVGEYGDGVFVAGVTEETPAGRAGFQNGDILFEIEGNRVYNLNRFHGVVGNWPQGESIRVKVRRKGEVKELKVFLGDPAKIRERDLEASPVDLGFTPSNDFVDLGVEVNAVAKGGAAEKAGLKPGDVIKKVDGRRVTNWEEFRGALQSRKPGDELKLTVLRDEKEQEIALKLAGKKTQE